MQRSTWGGNTSWKLYIFFVLYLYTSETFITTYVLLCVDLLYTFTFTSPLSSPAACFAIFFMNECAWLNNYTFNTSWSYLLLFDMLSRLYNIQSNWISVYILCFVLPFSVNIQDLRI